MKYPNIMTLSQVINSARDVSTLINGKWVPARPLGFMSFKSRCRAAWLVFTGKADALRWPAGQ